MMRVRDHIEQKIRAALSPSLLIIVDDSHRHQGHAGSHDQGESHFTVEVVSAAFENKSRVARQQLVYGILAEELKTIIHALSLSTRTPAEEAQREKNV